MKTGRPLSTPEDLNRYLRTVGEQPPAANPFADVYQRLTAPTTEDEEHAREELRYVPDLRAGWFE